MKGIIFRILAIDSNEDRVNAVLSYVTNAQIGDSTSEYFLRSLGVGNFDVCIVTTVSYTHLDVYKRQEHRPSPLEKRQKLHPREMVRIWIALLHQEKPEHVCVLVFLFVSTMEGARTAFHPNDNRATVVISREEFLRYLAAVGNTYEFIELY